MPQGLQAVLALAVLLPGFVSARIVRMMSPRNQQSELERVIEALVYSLFIYISYVLFWGASLPFEWRPQSVSGLPPYTVFVSKRKLFSLIAIAMMLGFSRGYVRARDLLLKALRKLNLTQRSSRESVWVDVFMNNGGFVQVGLSDGRSVIGWLKQYAEIGEERTLFLNVLGGSSKERTRWMFLETGC